MSERSEFAALPLTGSGFWESAGQPLRGRLFLGYLLFGEVYGLETWVTHVPGHR
jgi:hypothetical protein